MYIETGRSATSAGTIAFSIGGVATTATRNWKVRPEIYNRARYNISNINQQVTILQQILKIGASICSFLQCCEKITGFKLYSMSFGRLELAQGAICLYNLPVGKTCLGKIEVLANP